MELLCKDEVYSIVGAAFEVYNTLGPAFLEAVYQEALALEFTQRRIPFVPHHEHRIRYKGQVLQKMYVSDFVCHGNVIVEIKAVNQITPADHSQLLNYLAATQLTTGVLLNFGSEKALQWKRMALTRGRPER